MPPKANTEELEEQLDTAFDEFQDLASEIKETHDLGVESQSDESKVQLFNARYTCLESTYAKFISRFNDIRRVAKKLKTPLTDYEKSKEKIRSIYYESLAMGLPKNSGPSVASTNTSVVERSINDGHSQIKLPTINIPTFTGNISDWPAFQDTFMSLIHNNTELDNVQRFHYLKSSVKGVAAQAIASINISQDGYPLAWAALTKRFDNQRLQATHHLMNIFNFPPITKWSLSSLDQFSAVVLESATAFNNLNLSDPSGFILCTFALRLLDQKTRDRFENEFGSKADAPTWQQFSDFIARQTVQLQTCALTSNQKPSSTSGDQRATQCPKRVLMLTDSHNDRLKCPVCKKGHRIYDCSEFRSLTPQKRFELIKSLNRCLNCFVSGHSASQCPSTNSCRQCNSRHHSLLHFQINRPPNAQSKRNSSKKPTVPTESQTTSRSNQSSSTISLNHSGQAPKVNGSPDATTAILASASVGEIKIILGTAVARIKDPSGVYHPIRMLVDSGSQRSFITTKCAKFLKLPLLQNNHHLLGFANQPISGGKHQVLCTLIPVQRETPEYRTSAIVIDTITSDMPAEIIPDLISQNFRHLDLADSAFDQPGPIDFLLGADLFGEILEGEMLKSHDGLPHAVKTSLGWILFGPIASEPNLRSVHHACFTTAVSPANSVELSDLMTRFWEVEEVPNVQRIDPSDLESERHFLSTHTRASDGKYIVRLPFKNRPPNLESSEFIALKRFDNLERRFNREPPLKAEYTKVFQEYLEKHYLSISPEKGFYYLPHHCVLKDSISTKLRIVFDASASTRQGSLNDHLMSGPKLQQDIKDILLNFRIPQIVMTADISQMYLQILIAAEDRRYLHLFFRFDTQDKLEEFQFNRLPFGLSCSPFLAIRVLQQLVIDEGFHYPNASRVLLQDMYIDDLLTGADTIAEALTLQRELVLLLEKGGFVFKKWCSNAKELLETIPVTDPNSVVSLSDLEDNIVKILGMQWDPQKDSLSYRVHPKEYTPTKRGILSIIARMYDPLGYCSPVIFKAKTILQQLWVAKVGWDESVPSAIRQCWETFFLELPQLQSITIPRGVLPLRPANVILVGFADASSLGYAAVLYIRCQDQSGNVNTDLIVSKTRLAPLKTLSVPRLELCAALLLVNLLKSVESFCQRIKASQTFLFSDSATVLSWLHFPCHQLKTFVANRVVKILENSKITDWHHVRSEENAADVASRGIYPSGLVNHSMWWNGPDWLQNPVHQWPITRSPPILDQSTIPEKRALNILHTKYENQFLQEFIERFSSYSRLIRVFAYVRRFAFNLRARGPKRLGPLTLEELRSSTEALLKFIQTAHFHSLVDQSSTQPNSLKSLSIFVDSRGLYRVGGRLSNAPLSYEAKHPVVLPSKAHFVDLLVDHLHKAYLHAGPQLLHSLIRRRYWIISARRLIRSRIHRCLKCHRLKVKNLTPFMGDLPLSRFEQGRPFINVGVDFAGPFLMRESLRRKAAVSKAYVCLFVCLSTKAVHIEIVSQLTSSAFLACLDRFIARRGLPQRIMSDHGTNFIGAARHLKELYAWWTSYSVKQDIEEHLVQREITWSFIPPSAPHFGGLWEAGVKSLKYHLSRVMNSQPLTFEELTTVTSRIEAILNSRPLHPLSSSPEDLNLLTPGHFLIGAPLVALPEPEVIDPPKHPVSRWNFLHRCIGEMWRHWRRDYLHWLQQRVKWTTDFPNVGIGTLVLLIEPNVPPLSWPTGRVTAVFPGKDGVVRVVKVKTSSGEYTRPVTRLAPLLPD